MKNKIAFLIIVRFFLFLEERNIFDNYFIYFSHWDPQTGEYQTFDDFFIKSSVGSTFPERFIDAFSWNDTDEGADFWLNVHRDWNEELDLINEK